MDETFKSIYKGDYIWPYILPVQFKPMKPPDGVPYRKEDEGPEKESILDKKLCSCAGHSWNAHFERARYLKAKELAYREAMLSLAHQRTILENNILDHPCTDSEDVLNSLYNIDYAKKAFPVTDYRKMTADYDDPVVNPVPMPRDPLNSSYRDPSKFRKVAITNHPIHSATPITFVHDDSDRDWYKPTKSEYEEQFSALAKVHERSLQMFQETPYSSRR